MKVVCVDPAKVERIWPHARGFLKSAYDRAGDDNLESLKRDLDNKQALLWIVWDNEIIAAAVTKLVKVPTKLLCIVAACGGREISRWIGHIADLEDYARKENCDEIRVMGRHGWKAILPDYHEPWICLTKRLK